MSQSDYSIYLPSGETDSPWGVSVEAAGRTEIPPFSEYPPNPKSHPDDHALSWERGRILHNYQLLLISEGQGQFESRASGKRSIRPWTFFILFPEVWHRYQPKAQTGWTEHWIEVRGTVIDQLRESKIISPARPTMNLGPQPELLDLFSQCREVTMQMFGGYQAVLGSLTTQILARAIAAASAVGEESTLNKAIREAQSLISSTGNEPLDMNDVAKKVGMTYSYFRRAFKARTGLAPKQFHMHARLRRVQELLTNTSWPLRQISNELGYDSPFHLSGDFKSRTGLSPAQWRARLRESNLVS